MGLIDEIINDGIKETREYYEKAISNITNRYQAVYNRFREDSVVMEQLLADHGYKIVSYNNAIRENRIPFEISGDPFWSKENQARLRKSMAQAKAGKLTLHEISEVSQNL